MNPGEPFKEISIVTIGNEDELDGITIGYTYNEIAVSPPQKYFSESHLNCLGLSFFLASVEAFNGQNDFIILDDVISSFDSTHRKRFAELLFEKFAKRQIILLTHEYEWFKNYVSPIAKKKGWLIKEIKWSDAKGTHFEEEQGELKDRIKIKISEGNINELGNPIRVYLEKSLKEIAVNIEAKMVFKYNDDNEKRMPYELLNSLRSEINKRSIELKEKMPMIERIENSNVLNLLSHDNPFNPKLSDLKAFWADIQELENTFNCPNKDCKKPKVSLKHYDSVAKKIRCGCDLTKYNWEIK